MILLTSAYQFSTPAIIASFEFSLLFIPDAYDYFLVDESPDNHSLSSMFLFVANSQVIVFRERERVCTESRWL